MTPGPTQEGHVPDRDEALADGDQRGRVGPGSGAGLAQLHDGHEADDADDDDGSPRRSAWRRSRSMRHSLCRLITG